MFIVIHIYIHGLTMWLSRKESNCNEGDLGSIPGLGRFPGGGPSNQLQYSHLKNSMDRGAWQAIVHGVAKSRTQLSDFHFLSLRTILFQFLICM